MSATSNSRKEEVELQPLLPKPRVVRRVAEIQNRPFGFSHEGKVYDCNPTAEQIQQAIDGGHLEKRRAQLDRDDLDLEWLAKSEGNIDKIALQQKMYNARRIAYFCKYGWDGFPLRVEADGTMHDGTHSLRAAIHNGLDEVEVTIVK